MRLNQIVTVTLTKILIKKNILMKEAGLGQEIGIYRGKQLVKGAIQLNQTAADH